MTTTRRRTAEATEDPGNTVVTPQNAAQVPNNLAQVPNNLKLCQKVLRKHIKDKAKLQEDVLSLNATVEDLQKKLKQARTSKACTSMSAKICKTIKDVYRIHLFRRAKWIRGKDDMSTLADIACDYVFNDQERNEKGEDYKTTWVNTYTEHMKTVVNARRSYIQSQCKLAVFRYYKKHDKMPTLDDLMKCITRNIDVDDKYDYELFLWFCGRSHG